ncbi:MAG TPA: hypothetical protein DDY77_01175 [Clostridiales bacterium]|nr:hypothetical protein [Clostridiales bacterium]
MKFSDYNDGKTTKNAGGGKKGVGEENKKLLFSLLKQYEGKSKPELVAAIVKEAEKARAEGRLSNEELDSFKSMLYPFLDKNGKAELDGIIEKLKNS